MAEMGAGAVSGRPSDDMQKANRKKVDAKGICLALCTEHNERCSTAHTDIAHESPANQAPFVITDACSPHHHSHIWGFDWDTAFPDKATGTGKRELASHYFGTYRRRGPCYSAQTPVGYGLRLVLPPEGERLWSLRQTEPHGEHRGRPVNP